MKVPAGIKTNSMPRELRKTFSKARIRRGREVVRMIKAAKNRMNKVFCLLIILSMALPSLSSGSISLTLSGEDLKKTSKGFDRN